MNRRELIKGLGASMVVSSIAGCAGGSLGKKKEESSTWTDDFKVVNLSHQGDFSHPPDYYYKMRAILKNVTDKTASYAKIHVAFIASKKDADLHEELSEEDTGTVDIMKFEVYDWKPNEEVGIKGTSGPYACDLCPADNGPDSVSVAHIEYDME